MESQLKRRTPVRAEAFGKRFVMVAISAVYFAVRRLLALCGWKDRPRRIVLTYHVVNQDEIARFERQMRQLKKAVTPVFADDPDTVGPSAAVTFDDAFEDVIDRTLPVLARYAIPATIFVPTGYIGAPPGWARVQAHRGAARVASVDVLKNVDRRLVRLGSHTVTHPRLASLDPTRLRVELAASKQTLEGLTGECVRSVALPYGSCSPEVVAVARRTGYERVFANVPVRRDPSHLTGRVNVSAGDWPLEFSLKLKGAYEWMAVAVPAKRQLLTMLGRAQEA